jgi:hypothetical protein
MLQKIWNLECGRQHNYYDSDTDTNYSLIMKYVMEIRGCIKKFQDWTYRPECIYLI